MTSTQTTEKPTTSVRLRDLESIDLYEKELKRVIKLTVSMRDTRFHDEWCELVLFMISGIYNSRVKMHRTTERAVHRFVKETDEYFDYALCANRLRDIQQDN